MKSRANRLPRILDRLQPSESLVLITAAVIVGLFSGAGVWIFKALIELVSRLATGPAIVWLTRFGPWTVALVPMAGGLLVGLIVYFFVGTERHHGVAGIMEAVALAGGRLRYWRMPAKALASAISIGAGASVGPEDPSVQIGANLGSFLGQQLHLSDERMRALVAAGAAGGIAAAFNAPIAGVFFAIEIVLGELSGAVLSVVVIAAVISAVFTQAVAGTQPAFPVPGYAFKSAWELPLYLGLGLLAGPVAAIYIWALYVAQDFFHRLTRVPAWAKPPLAGLIVGAVGLFLPQALGVGYGTIGAILSAAAPSAGLLLALLVAKLLLTAISIGGGFQGGVFAPSLFLGATLGAAYGAAANALFPGLSVAPQAFAMVGMAAVLAGTVHAPITAILLLFEMTNDYRIILPLMFAVVLSLLIAQRLQKDSVYTLGLARKGIRLERGRDVEVLEGITVGDIMQTSPATLHEALSVADALAILTEQRHHGLPVLNGAEELVGILTLQDVQRVTTEAERQTTTVGAACTRELLVTYLDETMGAAMRRMGTRDVGRLPVVARDNPRRLLGLLRRPDVIRAYEAALTARAAQRQREQEVRLGALGGVRVEEAVVMPGAACAGQLIKEVTWPHGLVIASLRRGRETLVPDGSTRLQSGDVLVVVGQAQAQANLRELCAARAAEPAAPPSP